MSIVISPKVFEGIAKWMARSQFWPGYFQEVLHEHMHAYCDLYEIDTFEELSEAIGDHWLTCLNDMAFNDFLSRETEEEGNIVDAYLKRRGWTENTVSKAYLKGIRSSVISLYEVSDIRPGISFLARDLIRGGDPVLVEERSATQTLAPWDHVAMLLVEVRGHTIISGGILPFDNDMSQEIVEEVLEGVDDDAANSELTHELAILARLKTTAPLFSEYWLTETMHDFVEDITPRMTNSDGDEIEFIKFHFRFKKGTTQAKIHNALEKADDLDAIGEKVWNWIDVGGESSQTNTKNSPAHSLDGHTILGNLKMHGKILEAQTNSAARAERLQPMLEALAGDLLHPPLMVRQTLEQAMQDYRENPSHSEAVELPTEEENEIIKQLLDKQYRATLDQPVGMLGDETPRNAAKTKAGKKKLVEWLKYLEQQTAKHQFPNSQSTYDFTWIWQELGVTDLRK